MTVKATQNFFKKRDRLITKGIITLEEYEKTLKLYKKNPNDPKIRPHKINCKKNHHIVSITIPDTQIRILINIKACDSTSISICSWIGKHREYERIIKDQRNCKSIFINCDEINNLIDE